MAASRAYSTEYTDHTALIHSFARKGWSRLIASHVSVDYDDVFQELSLVFVKAIKAYDPSKGYSFTAYAGRAMWNGFNRFAQRHLDEANELGLMSIQALEDKAEDGDSMNLYELIDSGAPTPEQQLERKQEMLQKLRALSPTAKFIAAQLISLSEEVEQAMTERNRKAEAEGRRSLANPTPGFIADVFGVDRAKVRAAVEELHEVYGV